MADSKKAKSASGASNEEHPSLDALAAVLRVYGEEGFATAELDALALRNACEAWARHLLLGWAPPGRERGRGSQREWGELQRFFTDQRKNESAYVGQSLSGLRSTLWFFIQSMARALPEDHAGDQEIRTGFSRLREVMQGNDLEAIRVEAERSISQVEAAINSRREREGAQRETLAQQADRFAHELVSDRQSFETEEETGLYSGAALEVQLTRWSELGASCGRGATVYRIRLDDESWVEERFGADAASKIRIEVAHSVASCWRRLADFVAFDGKLFAAVMPSETPERDLRTGEQAVLSVRDLEVPFGDEVIRVSVSIGAARLVPGESANDWLGHADAALSRAESEGRDRLVLWAP